MTARPAPYPPDTRAKGWRFELDYERIEQSATWGLTTLKPEARPWLLMTWYTAWKQVPCGSMPADPELFAALIGASDATFAKHRKVLLRGWWLADDGRLYHDTLVQRVAEMLRQRRSDADRQAANRAAKKAAGLPPKPAEITPVSHVTPDGVQGESSTGTGTNTAEAIASDGAGAPAAGAGQAPEPPAPPPAQPSDGKAALWRESLEVLQAGGCKSEDMARSFMGKLVKDHGAEVVREAVTAAIVAQPVDAREYLTATCKRLKGDRREPLTVPSDAAEKTAAMLRQQAAVTPTKPPAEVLALRSRRAAS